MTYFVYLVYIQPKARPARTGGLGAEDPKLGVVLFCSCGLVAVKFQNTAPALQQGSYAFEEL